MVAVTDNSGETWFSEEWGPRSGHIKGEGTVYCPHHLTSCLEIKMYCSEGKRILHPNWGLYTCAGGKMSLSVQLFNPLRE
jgi:hypothetical protein